MTLKLFSKERRRLSTPGISCLLRAQKNDSCMLAWAGPERRRSGGDSNLVRRCLSVQQCRCRNRLADELSDEFVCQLRRDMINPLKSRQDQYPCRSVTFFSIVIFFRYRDI